eukprot:7370538-Karenia_brevis.AAC.1
MDVLIKGDQEPAMKCFTKGIQEERKDGRSVVEEAPVQGKGSDGVIERAVQERAYEIHVSGIRESI